MRSIVVLLAVMVMASSVALPRPVAAADDPLDALLRHDAAYSADRLGLVAGSLSHTRYPSQTNSAGTWDTTGSSGWTSGFFPGSLWSMYELSGDPIWMTRAIAWQAGLEGRKNDTSTHDVGFVITTSFGNGYRLTGTDAYRQVILTAAGSLATRYNPVVGMIRSSGSGSSDFPVIIDNMMNLELLFWASKHGGSATWYDMAVSHALRTMTDHVRPDGSTYQVVHYDQVTGAVKSKGTNQGASASSTWSRGQAWAIYGFTTAYGETGDPRFLDTARRTAYYFVSHLPADMVPYWDFQAPGIPNEPRDSSAASVAAAGLLELAQLELDPNRATDDVTAARAILASLSSAAYLSEGTGNQAVLLHGTQNERKDNHDTGLSYGDYYFLVALLRSPAVRGRISDRATGQPIVGATVTSNTGSTRSRLGGDFTLAGIGAGARSITVSAPGYQPATAPVTVPVVGGVSLDVALASGGGGAPVAEFSASPTSGPPGQQVAFTDSSSNSPTSWAWDFGDPGSGSNNTSTLQNPIHTYASAGQYTVKLTATNGSGSNQTTKTNFITISSGGGSTITLTPDADAQIKVGSSSTISDTTHLRTREENPVASSTYRSYLRFNVQGVTGTITGVKLRLYVTTSSSNTQRVYNTTSNPNWPEVTANSTNTPTFGANLLGSSVASTSGAYVEIPLSTTSVGGNGLVTFGLKSSGTTSAYFASKELTSPVAPPELVISQAVGSNPPVADFGGTPTKGTPNTSVQFSDLSTNGPTSWNWDFGDGSPHGTTQNPSHVYAALGSYDVTLIAANAAGPSTPTKKSAYITIGAKPVASFTVDNSSGPAPLTVNFTDTSTNSPTSWAWDFDNNGTVDDTTQNPSHQFNTGGTFTVKLTATNAFGSDTTTRPVTATSSPGPGETVTVPVAFDAHVNSSNPTKNYGNLTPIRTREDPAVPGNSYRPYFQFAVPAFSGRVTSVKLQLYVTTASTAVTQSVYAVGNAWTEAGITWNNAPPISGSAIGSAVAGAANAYVEIPLALSISPGTTYSLALKSSGATSVYFNSDDAASNKPQLVIATTP